MQVSSLFTMVVSLATAFVPGRGTWAHGVPPPLPRRAGPRPAILLLEGSTAPLLQFLPTPGDSAQSELHLG
jgi:hypothetical protein